MKGVILSHNPHVRIVDLTHAIDPQDILQGAFILNAAVDYFPANTVHLSVVDPGVGSERSAVVVRRAPHFFVAPDNGILSLILSKGIDTAVRIENTEFFNHPVSATFHGRDIFAPVAGYLSKRNKLEKIGSTICADELVQISPRFPEKRFADRIEGCVVAIDSFGNLMTNISTQTLNDFSATHSNKKLGIRIGPTLIPTISKTYSSVGKQDSVAVIGSRNYLEVSINMGNAAQQFGVHKGDRVIVTPIESKKTL
ncbi:MAG: SAM-dependent chlorinase/fluorinase, partial [Desulfobacteraceae bacterium]|jgi:S-adenosylmethionine hydrolase